MTKYDSKMDTQSSRHPRPQRSPWAASRASQSRCCAVRYSRALVSFSICLRNQLFSPRPFSVPLWHSPSRSSLSIGASGAGPEPNCGRDIERPLEGDLLACRAGTSDGTADHAVNFPSSATFLAGLEKRTGGTNIITASAACFAYLFL